MYESGDGTFGIMESTIDNCQMIWLYKTKEEREEAWQSRSKVGRDKLKWTKCIVKITHEKVIE